MFVSIEMQWLLLLPRVCMCACKASGYCCCYVCVCVCKADPWLSDNSCIRAGPQQANVGLTFKLG